MTLDSLGPWERGLWGAQSTEGEGSRGKRLPRGGSSQGALGEGPLRQGSPGSCLAVQPLCVLSEA